MPKIGCDGNASKGIKKEVRIEKIHANTFFFHLVKKIVKIGPVDPEIICLKLKKRITEGKIYSPVGKCAERAKLTQAKYIALPESLPRGLKSLF